MGTEGKPSTESHSACFVRAWSQFYDAAVPPSLRVLTTVARDAPGRAFVLAGVVIALAVTPAVFAPALYDDFTLAKQASLLFATSLILIGLSWEGNFLPRHVWVRRLVIAWAALLFLSFVTGIDRRGSVLGYYQYRQGLLTQFAYIALLLGASRLARDLHWGWLAAGGTMGLAAVTGYTAVQATGQDPVNWWIDTSARAIGSIGNANELAAYAVLALALCGLGQQWTAKSARAWVIGVAACASFIVLESESRSGLIAFGIASLAYPAFSTVAGARPRESGGRWLLLLGGTAVGAVLSTLAGGATGTADRFQAGVAQSDAGNSTRIELWKGTLSVVAASPLSGFGPDGLYLAFPRHRPADLGGAFADYDLTAQSSHNAILDVAANQGLPGLGAIMALLVLIATRSVITERPRRSPEIPFIWAAMTGYVALVLANPVSLAAHALFFVLVGVLHGRSEQGLPERRGSMLPPPVRLALALPSAVALCAVAVLLPLADLRANLGWTHFAEKDFVGAAAEYERANQLLPFERVYAASAAESWLAAGVTGGAPPLREAVKAYESFDAQFGFASGEAIGLVTAQIGLDETARAEHLIQRSLDLNPHGVSMDEYIATLRAAVAAGGTLHYSDTDRWVFVTPTEGPAGP